MRVSNRRAKETAFQAERTVTNRKVADCVKEKGGKYDGCKERGKE